MANYLNNKDLLREIHKSKFTYCWINDKEKHYFYDAIIFDKDEITEELLETSLQIRANRKAVQAFDKELFSFIFIVTVMYIFILFFIYLSTPHDFYFQLDSTAARVIRSLSFLLAFFGLYNLRNYKISY